MKTLAVVLLSALTLITSFKTKPGGNTPDIPVVPTDSIPGDSIPADTIPDIIIPIDTIPEEPVKPKEIILEKELGYDKYTLEDNYTYKDTPRSFQWDKIKVKLQATDSLSLMKGTTWAVLQNKNNKNGQPPLARDYGRNKHTFIIDSFGVERQQAIPLYLPHDLVTPERYGYDGSLVEFVENRDGYVVAKTTNFEGEFLIPEKYIYYIEEPEFKHVVVIDRLNQNISTLEKVGEVWKIRSMNPATTGVNSPPHKKETPTGLFMMQNKLPKMYYYVDGTTDIAGYAPWASRFCKGAYVHGVPVEKPATEIIEYSWSLGTIPRSHMCVRNVSSHAKYIYDNFPSYKTIIFVIE